MYSRGPPDQVPLAVLPWLDVAPAALADSNAGSGCGVGGTVLGEMQADNRRRRQSSPTRSEQSTDRVNPEALGWTKRLRIGSTPPNRTPCPSRMSLLEQSIHKYAEEPTKSVVQAELGFSFNSLIEAYSFYNLYSWDIGFEIRYGKSRLNPRRRNRFMRSFVDARRAKPDADKAGHAGANASL